MPLSTLYTDKESTEAKNSLEKEKKLKIKNTNKKKAFHIAAIQQSKKCYQLSKTEKNCWRKINWSFYYKKLDLIIASFPNKNIKNSAVVPKSTFTEPSSWLVFFFHLVSSNPKTEN